MPFFGSTRHPEPEPIPEPVPERRHGLFGRKHEPVHTQPAPVTNTSGRTSGGLFGSRHHTTSPARDSMSSSSMSSRSSVEGHHHGHHNRLSRTGGGGGSILGRKLGRSNMEMDPSIIAARERVMGAEAAEADADRALAVARTQVRDAREHMRLLEDELREEARRAKIKQHQVKDLNKRGKGLGRHG